MDIYADIYYILYDTFTLIFMRHYFDQKKNTETSRKKHFEKMSKDVGMTAKKHSDKKPKSLHAVRGGVHDGRKHKLRNSYITGSRFVSDLSALGARARSAREHSADKSETNRGPVI